MSGQAPDREALRTWTEYLLLRLGVTLTPGVVQGVMREVADVVRDAEQRGYERALVDVSERSDDGIEFGPDNHRRLLRMLRDVSARHAGADQ